MFPLGKLWSFLLELLIKNHMPLNMALPVVNAFPDMASPAPVPKEVPDMLMLPPPMPPLGLALMPIPCPGCTGKP